MDRNRIYRWEVAVSLRFHSILVIAYAIALFAVWIVGVILLVRA